MSFDRDMAKLIQKYMSEHKNMEFTIEEILQRPRYKRVYYWWKAKEVYEGKPMPNFTVDQIKDIYGEDHS